MEAIPILLIIFGSVFGLPVILKILNDKHKMDKLKLELEAKKIAQLQPSETTPAQLQIESNDAAAMALKLPEPQRMYALALLCRLEDAEQGELDAKAKFTVAETQTQYLPETLQSYLALTPQAKTRLAGQGTPAEDLLQQQLHDIQAGVDAAIQQDHKSAQRLLTQGSFLREKFRAESTPEEFNLEKKSSELETEPLKVR